MEQRVPKRRHIKFRRSEITQKKTYNIIMLCLTETNNFIIGTGIA
jgi:hypothetical protein